MKKLSKHRFKILSDLGAVGEVVFPRRSSPYVLIEGEKYEVRGLSRLELYRWTSE